MVGVQIPRLQPAAGGRIVMDIKGGEDFRLVGAVAHGAGVGAIAQGQAQGINHDRLAGPGFTGDHRQFVGDIQIQLFDNGKIADVDVCEHSGRDRAWLILGVCHHDREIGGLSPSSKAR